MGQISPNVYSGPFTGNGVTTAFAFTFSIAAATQIKVTVDDVVVTTGFTVTFGDTSGTVTFSVAPASGAVILLESNPDYLQTSNFANEGAYKLDTVNLINRRAAIRDLVLKSNLDRAIKVPQGEGGLTLPSLADGDGRVIGYSAAVGFVWVANTSVAIAEDVARSEAAEAGAIVAQEAVAADLATIETLVAFQPRRAVKSADTSVTASVTLISDPDLTVPLPANSLMILRARINYSAALAGDIKWRHASAVAAASVQLNRRAIAPGDTAYSGVAIDTIYSAGDVVIDGAAGSGVIEFDATILNGAAAGVLAFKWAQNTSSATATIVKAGSYIEYIPLPSSGTFAFANNAIAKLGGFNGPAAAGGHNVMTAVGPTAIAHSYIETMATGTACDAQLFSGSYALEVDGVATTFTAPAGWSYVNLFTGLSDTPHRVRLTGVAYDSDITLRVAGTGPDLTRPSDVPAFYPLTLAPNDGYVGRDAPMLVGTYNGYPSTESVWTVSNGFGFHFNATTTSVRIWFYDGASVSTIVLKQDGAVISTTVPPGTGGNYQVITLATGLTGAHDYEVCFISSQKTAYCYAVLVDTLTASAHPAKALDAYYGDSIVAMSASPTLADARVGDSYILANSLGRAAVRVGVGGTGVSVDASGNLAVKYGRDNTAGITGLPQAPTRVFVCYGTNDEYFGVSTATFQADYQTMLAAIRAGLPSAKIYARGILPHTRAPAASPGLTPSQVATLTATYNAAMQAAVTAIADANIVYVSTLGWVDTTGGSGDFLDTVHVTAQGYAKIAAAQALVL